MHHTVVWYSLFISILWPYNTMVCEDSCIKPLSHAVYKPGWRSAYANVINRRSNVARHGPKPMHYNTCLWYLQSYKRVACRTQRGSITCMLRTKVVSSFAKSAKVVLVLQDNPERRMWLLYTYWSKRVYYVRIHYMGIVLGYVKCTYSDGSSPVTTTPLLNLFSYTTGFISMQAYWFVRIDMPFL